MAQKNRISKSFLLTFSFKVNRETAQKASAPNDIRRNVRPTGSIHSGIKVLAIGIFIPKRMFAAKMAMWPCHLSFVIGS